MLALASPWLAYGKSFYSETATGLALICSLWAMESRRPKSAALAAGIAAAFKPAFAVAGVGFVAERLWTRQWREAAEMSTVLAACGLALLAWNYWLARTFVIPIESSNTIYPSAGRSLYETFLGPGYGLFRFAPWTIFVFTFLRLGLLRGPSALRQIAISIVLYTLVLAYVRPFPSMSYGPRYWVAFLPWLAIAAVEGLTHWPLMRNGLILTAVLGAAIAIPSALRYRELFEHSASLAWCGLW